MVVFVESEDLEKNRQFVERLEPEDFRSRPISSPICCFTRRIFKLFGTKALLLAPTNELESLDQTLKAFLLSARPAAVHPGEQPRLAF